jgi:ribosomal protein S27AE
MTNSAYTTQLRALMCPNCGAPVTTAAQGGSFQCGYCRTMGSVAARMDARHERPPPSPAEEQARLGRLAFQHEQGHLASPYSTFVAPQDVTHLAELRPPNSWGPWLQAWKYAVGLVAQDPSPHNQKRVAWLAQLTGTAILNLGASDPTRARAIRETALELLPDPGHKQLMRCALSRSACLQGDLASAEQWLAACDPYPNNITLDTDYRMSAAYLAVAHGQWGRVLEVLGNQPGVVPIDFGRDMLAGLLRVHACEELGYLPAAEGQLRWLFEEEKKLSGPILLAIMKTNAPLNLCRRSCARLGIQIPS